MTKANSNKARTMAQNDWSYNSIQHLKAEMHIKSKRSEPKISEEIKKPKDTKITKRPKKSNYKSRQLKPSLDKFQELLHDSTNKYLILDFEFNMTGNKTNTENTHIFQIAGQIFNDFDRFNYYNFNSSMKSLDQFELLRQTNVQYSDLKDSDQFPEMCKRVREFVDQHNITHIISWGNAQDIHQLQYWEQHFNLEPMINNQIQWIDLNQIIGMQLNKDAQTWSGATLRNFYQVLGLDADNIHWHQADQDVQAINQICHIYYERNSYQECMLWYN